MHSSPNYIHFRVQWQVLGPESPGQRFEREQFQEFFGKLNANPRFSGYDDFSYRPDRCELAKSRGSAPQGGEIFSKVVYANDALTVVEEFAEESTTEFSQKIKVVLDSWFQCFPETLIVIQSCCLRALVLPSHCSDSRNFIGDTVLQLGPVFQSRLAGMPHKVGMHFACQRKDDDSVMNLETKVGSWRDNRSVWIEVNSVAPMPQPLNAARHDQAEVVFGRTQQFLEKEVLPILIEYDKSDRPTEGEDAQ